MKQKIDADSIRSTVGTTVYGINVDEDTQMAMGHLLYCVTKGECDDFGIGELRALWKHINTISQALHRRVEPCAQCGALPMLAHTFRSGVGAEVIMCSRDCYGSQLEDDLQKWNATQALSSQSSAANREGKE